MSKYWSNCVPSAEASGKTPCKTVRLRGYDTVFYPVEVVQGDICNFCGHTAFYSKRSPNSEETQNGTV